MSRKRKYFFGTLGIIVLGVICVYWYINHPHPRYEKLRPDFTLTSKALFDEFKSNGKASALKYNGKMVEIKGTISKIEASDTLVTIVFAFSQGLFGDEGIRCAMLSKFNESTRLLKEGNTVDLKGLCQGYNETDVILEKCSLVK
ncbi:MAG: hypothetical protein Q8908_00935 [Bacteroidota bacterium]|nr:hypothetical protein [Bacteroidota bacterium]